MPGCALRAGRLLGTLIFAVPLTALAQERASKPPGETAWALPGIVRIGVPGLGPRRVAFAGAAGYGYTESQGNGDGAHHRAFGSVGASVVPLPALELALKFDGRYDIHPDDGQGSHGAGVGDPRLLARYGGALGDGSVTLGVEAIAWVPGQDAPSLSFDATTLDARALAAFTPKKGPVVAGLAGFRWDNSAAAAPDKTRMRPGDRLALGLSDSNAFLAGVGVSVPAGNTEILGEATADFLIGSDAPELLASPIRLTAGARHALSSAFALEGLFEVSPSKRPSLDPAAPLVPVEPRFAVTLGLRYRLPFDAPRDESKEPSPSTTNEPKPVAVPVAAKEGPFVVAVVGPDGAAVEGATVEIVAGEKRWPAEPAEKAYRAATVPFGDVTVVVKAEGFVPVEQPARHEGSAARTEIKLEAAVAEGQLRGLIRSFSGKGLGATIRVDPLGKEVKADPQGNFAVDLPPGDYEVTVTQQGFKPQHRKIHVDQNGVTVLNAELFEGK